MKNVTVTLERDVARWARIRAAEREMSLSRYLGELLRDQMDKEARYETAMGEYLSRSASALKPTGSGYPSRAETHERSERRSKPREDS
jgi:hypothetical protein